MKKFLFVLFGVFAFSGAFAAGENVPTSKSYVDAAVAQKQDKISASAIMPAGYTALEYIETTGTQWIDTLVTLGVDFEIYLDAMVSGRADHILLAGNLDVNRYNASVFASGINGVFENGGIDFGGDNNRFYIGISPFWVMSYNGVKRVLVRRYTPSGTLRVFSGTVGRLYNLKIYSGPLLQFNGIPARRDSDGVLGMYDTVSNTFFTNSGTGEFIAGPVIIPDPQVLTNTGTAGEYGTKGIYDATGEYATQQNNLVDAVTMNAAVQNAIDSEFRCIEWLDPNDHSSDCLLLQLGGISEIASGYTRLEYIESTGTQYIDTGRKFMHGDEFYFEYMPMASYSSENKGYGAGANLEVNITGGGRNSGSRVCMYDFGGNLCYEPQLLYNYTLGRRYIENWTLKSGVFHSVLTDVNDGSTYTISKGSISQSYDSGDSVYLWRDHSYSYPSKSRIYRTWLKRADGTMAFDLFPARRNSDNVVGMYDTISGQFFTNSGTDEFIAGPVANMYLPAGN